MPPLGLPPPRSYGPALEVIFGSLLLSENVTLSSYLILLKKNKM